MREDLGDQVRISHMLDSISEIESYIKNVSFTEFMNNSEKRYATIKQIEIIGEVCNRISGTFKNLHPEIKWKEIRGFRNISIHEYFGVNFQLVWEITVNDLPDLKEKFSSANEDL